MPSCRPAQIEDQEILGELLKKAQAELREQRGGPIYLLTEVRSDFSNLADELDDSKTKLIVGVFEDLVVGWGCAQENQIPNGPKVGLVKEIYVDPQARGIGVGEDILSTLLDWMKESKCDGVQGTALPGNRETKGLFERFGIKARMLTLYKDFRE